LESSTRISSAQGWVFAAAKSIFAGTVEKTGKNCGKNWQKLAINLVH